MKTVFNQIERTKLVPVVTIDDADNADRLSDALVSGGLACAEITFRTDAAAEALERMNRRGDLLLGAGTVLTVAQAELARDTGAQFIVAPGTNPSVVEWCRSNDMPVIPGVATPTDIELAMSFGLTTLKFFPAEAMGGVKTLKAVSAPYRSIRFMPTGGVNKENLLEYLALPSVIACGGSWMVKKDLIASEQFDRIRDLVAEAMKAIKAA